MPTDQPGTPFGGAPTDAPEPNFGGGLTGSGLVPPLEVEGGAPRGPTRNSPIDPGMPPTDADGATEAESRVSAGQVGAPEPHPRSQ